MTGQFLIRTVVVCCALPIAAFADEQSPAAAGESSLRAVESTRETVLVLPFIDSTSTAPHDWVGRALHRSMVAELERVNWLQSRSATPSGKPVASVEAARRLGMHAGADIVTFGSYDLADDQLNVVCTAVDVATGTLAGEFETAGAVRDLFWIEDAIAEQLIDDLARLTAQPGDHSLALDSPTTRPAPPVNPLALIAVAEQNPGGFAGSALEDALHEHSAGSELLERDYWEYRYGERSQFARELRYRDRTYFPRRIVPPGTDGTGAQGDGEVAAGENQNQSPGGGVANRSSGGNQIIDPFGHQAKVLLRPTPGYTLDDVLDSFHINAGQRGGNYNRTQFRNYNEAPSGGAPNRSLGGHTLTGSPSGGVGDSSGGNTVSGGAGNIATGSSGNSNAGVAGSNSN